MSVATRGCSGEVDWDGDGVKHSSTLTMDILTFDTDAAARAYMTHIPPESHTEALDFWVWANERDDFEIHQNVDDLAGFSYEFIDWLEAYEEEEFKDTKGTRGTYLRFRRGRYVGEYVVQATGPLVHFRGAPPGLDFRVSFGVLPDTSPMEALVDETLARWTLD